MRPYPNLSSFAQTQLPPKERVFFFSCSFDTKVFSGLLRTSIDPADATFWAVINTALQQELNLGPKEFTITALSLLKDI